MELEKELIAMRSTNHHALTLLKNPLRDVIICDLAITPDWIEKKIQLNQSEKSWLLESLGKINGKLNVVIENWPSSHKVMRVYVGHDKTHVKSIRFYYHHDSLGKPIFWTEEFNNTQTQKEETNLGEYSKLQLKLFWQFRYRDNQDTSTTEEIESCYVICFQVVKFIAEKDEVKKIFEPFQEEVLFDLAIPTNPKSLEKYYKIRYSEPPNKLAFLCDENQFLMRWSVEIIDNEIYQGRVSEIIEKFPESKAV